MTQLIDDEQAQERSFPTLVKVMFMLTICCSFLIIVISISQFSEFTPSENSQLNLFEKQRVDVIVLKEKINLFSYISNAIFCTYGVLLMSKRTRVGYRLYVISQLFLIVTVTIIHLTQGNESNWFVYYLTLIVTGISLLIYLNYRQRIYQTEN